MNPDILYEDNHIIIVNKAPGDIVQGDKTGDATMGDAIKHYLKMRYDKPGNVFLGVTHRLDRPTSGVVVFAKTSKALIRMNDLFRRGEVQKVYHAIVAKTNLGLLEPMTLEHYLTRNERLNKSTAHQKEVRDSKKAVLDFENIASSDRYSLLKVHLHTGRHHQIRCQLAAIGLPIKGDLKYGAPRSNPDGSICLHAREISFVHPVSKQPIHVVAPYPQTSLWQFFDNGE